MISLCMYLIELCSGIQINFPQTYRVLQIFGLYFPVSFIYQLWLYSCSPNYHHRWSAPWRFCSSIQWPTTINPIGLQLVPFKSLLCLRQFSCMYLQAIYWYQWEKLCVLTWRMCWKFHTFSLIPSVVSLISNVDFVPSYESVGTLYQFSSLLSL